MNIIETQNHFGKLTTEQKYKNLLQIFTIIKDKNDNCGYIFEKLTNEPTIFTDELMIDIFSDVMKVYEQAMGYKKKNDDNSMASSVSIMKKIHEAEQLQNVQDEKMAEKLLCKI